MGDVIDDLNEILERSKYPFTDFTAFEVDDENEKPRNFGQECEKSDKALLTAIRHYFLFRSGGSRTPPDHLAFVHRYLKELRIVTGVVVGKRGNNNYIVKTDSRENPVPVVVIIKNETLRASDKMARKKAAFIILPTRNNLAVAAISQDEQKLFGIEEITDIEEFLETYIEFWGLTRSQRDILLGYVESELPTYEMETKSPEPFEKHQYEDVFKITKKFYTNEQQARIQSMIEKTSRATDAKQRAIAQSRLDYILNISPVNPSRVIVTEDELRKKFDERIYGAEKVKELFCDIVCSNQLKKSRRFLTLLIYGPPGVGKTSFASLFSDIARLPLIRIDANSLDSVLDLVGDDAAYDRSEPGIIAEEMRSISSSEAVLLLDEIEKCTRTNNQGDPTNILISVLSGKVPDKYLEYPIELRNTIIIATCNCEPLDLPPALRNRFNVVLEMKGYMPDEKYHIATEYILPALRKQFQTTADFTAAAIRYVISCCGDEGARDLNDNLELCLRRMIREGSESKRIGVADVRKILDPIVDTNSPGVILNREREFYSDETRRRIREYISQYESSKSENKHQIKDRIDCALAVKKRMSPIGDDISWRELSLRIKETHYGMQQVLEDITAGLVFSGYGHGSNNNIICLSGAPGVGKTSVVNALSEAIGCESPLCIHMNSIQNPAEIKGSIISSPGLLLNGLKQIHGEKGVIILFDEIDKVTTPAITESLIEILDNSSFSSPYLNDMNVSLEGCIFMMTCNEYERIPEAIKSRLWRIQVPAYSREQKIEIMDGYILKKIGKTLGGMTIALEDDAKEKILKMDNEDGLRTIERELKRACGRILCSSTRKPDSIVITADDIILNSSPSVKKRVGFE